VCSLTQQQLNLTYLIEIFKIQQELKPGSSEMVHMQRTRSLSTKPVHFVKLTC
jgi:hypothetical protein